MKRFGPWAALGVLLVVAAAVALFTLPIGTGEVRTAPDGRHCARATTVVQRRLGGGERRSLVYEVTRNPCEESAGPVVWRAEHLPAAGSTLDYGTRGERYVVWSSDGGAVTFALDGGREVTIPVP